MKKFIYLLMALPMLILASCSDDDDLPNVKFTVNYEGGTEVDGVIYTVQGTELAFTGIYVTPAQNTKNAALGGATYYWDYLPAGTTIVEPFARAFDTSLYPVGNHQVQIVCPVYQVDCTPATATLVFPVKIVASADEIPTPTEPQGTLNPEPTLESND